MGFCTNCGKKVGIDKPFCPECGASNVLAGKSVRIEKMLPK
jgi:ribosomal protein S27AE